MFFAWVAALIYGINTVVGKLTIRHKIGNPWLFHFIWEFFIFAGIAPFAILSQATVPAQWGSVLVAGILTFLTGLAYVLALNKLDVSILGPLYNARSMFTALLGAAFLSEILSRGQYMLIIAIFAAGIALSVDERFKINAFFRPEIALGLLAVFISGVCGFAIKTSVATNGFWTTSFWAALISAALSFCTIPLFRKDLSHTPIRAYKGAVISGLIAAFGDLAANKAFSINVTIASAIISIPFSMLIAFFFSAFAPALLERHSVRVYAIRFAAAAAMLLAAIGLSRI